MSIITFVHRAELTVVDLMPSRSIWILQVSEFPSYAGSLLTRTRQICWQKRVYNYLYNMYTITYAKSVYNVYRLIARSTKQEYYTHNFSFIKSASKFRGILDNRGLDCRHQGNNITIIQYIARTHLSYSLYMSHLLSHTPILARQ